MRANGPNVVTYKFLLGGLTAVAPIAIGIGLGLWHVPARKNVLTALLRHWAVFGGRNPFLKNVRFFGSSTCLALTIVCVVVVFTVAMRVVDYARAKSLGEDFEARFLKMGVSPFLSVLRVIHSSPYEIMLQLLDKEKKY